MGIEVVGLSEGETVVALTVGSGVTTEDGSGVDATGAGVIGEADGSGVEAMGAVVIGEAVL